MADQIPGTHRNHGKGDQVTVSFWGKTPPGQRQDDEGNDQG